jgi:hypothetical protein
LQNCEKKLPESSQQTGWHRSPRFPTKERKAMKQRRAERLQEIMADLRTLTEWKKP